MDKKDILEKAKKENNGADEMYNYIYRRAAQIAMVVGLGICCIVMVVDLIMNLGVFSLLGRVMFIMQLAMQSTLYGFLAIKCKKGVDIACFVLDSVALLAFLISTIIYLVGLA